MEEECSVSGATTGAPRERAAWKVHPPKESNWRRGWGPVMTLIKGAVRISGGQSPDDILSVWCLSYAVRCWPTEGPDTLSLPRRGWGTTRTRDRSIGDQVGYTTTHSKPDNHQRRLRSGRRTQTPITSPPAAPSKEKQNPPTRQRSPYV